MPNTDSSGDKRDQNSGQLRHWIDYSTIHSLSWFKMGKIKPKANGFCYFTRQWWISLNLNIHWIFSLLGYMSTLLHDGTLGRRTCLCYFSLSPALPEKWPRSRFGECSIVNIGENHPNKDKNCQVSKAWVGTLFQLVIAEDERSSEDAGGLMLELLLWNTLILLIAIFFFQAPCPSCLNKAALHVDWGRGNPVCSCHRPVMNHYPVIWLPSPPNKGRRRADLEEETTVETST